KKQKFSTCFDEGKLKFKGWLWRYVQGIGLSHLKLSFVKRWLTENPHIPQRDSFDPESTDISKEPGSDRISSRKLQLESYWDILQELLKMGFPTLAEPL